MQKKYLPIFLFLLILTLLTYTGAFRSEFIGDDIGRLLDSKSIYEKGYSSVIQEILPDRPLLMASLWLNYSLGELNPIGYKIINIVIHFLCGLMFFLVLKQFIQFYSSHLISETIKFFKIELNSGEIISFMAAAFFIVHPIHNQAVMSIIQRGVQLSTLFSLLSLYFFVQNIEQKDKKNSLLFSIIFYLFSILSKPNTIILPLIFSIYLKLLKNNSIKEIFNKIWFYLIISLIPVYYYFVLEVSVQTEALSSFEYFLTQARVIFFYFQKYLWPTSLQFYYPVNVELSAIYSLNSYLLASVHILFCFLLVFIVAKNKSLWALFFIFGYITFIPESSFFAINHVAFDHRNYFSFVFIVAGMQMLFWRIFSQSKKNKVLFFIINFFVLITHLVMNRDYITKIDTCFKWQLYNAEANPFYAKSYIYVQFKSQSVENAKILIDQAMLQISKDTSLSEIDKRNKLVEYNKYLEFVKYFTLSKDEKYRFLLSQPDYLYSNRASVYYSIFLEMFLSQQVSQVLPKTEGVLFMNSYYLNIFSQILAKNFSEEVAERIALNIKDFLIYNKMYKVSPEQFIESHDLNLILKGYKNISLLYSFFHVPVDIEAYEKIIINQFGENNEEVLKAFQWARQI